jgi:hypothetical protein
MGVVLFWMSGAVNVFVLGVLRFPVYESLIQTKMFMFTVQLCCVCHWLLEKFQEIQRLIANPFLEFFLKEF